MSTDNKKLIGALVSIYMKSGNIYYGAVKEVSESYFLLVNPSGKCYYIKDMEGIECISYIVSNKKIISEKDTNDEIPQHVTGDIQSLTELRQMKAKEELKEIRNKLRSRECETKEVEYASPLSALNAVKKHT